MRSVEETARAKGHATVGLAVGVENLRARALYLRLGYWETEIPPFEVTWTYRDGRGAERVEGETCTYFTKRLALED